MTAGDDIRALALAAAGLGRPAGRPSTPDRNRGGPDLVDLLDLVGAHPAGAGLVVFEALCVPVPLRTPAYAAALGDALGDAPGSAGGVVPGHRFFVHEAALHVRVGDAGVLAEQWSAVAEREDAVVRLVPFAAGHAGLLRAPFVLPVGAQRAELLDRVALDAPSSRAEFRRRAGAYRAEFRRAGTRRGAFRRPTPEYRRATPESTSVSGSGVSDRDG